MPVELSCDTCGSSFCRKPSHVREKNFCSKKCLEEYRGTRTEVICDSCGKKVLKTQSELREHNFCDRTCSGQWRSKNIVGEQHPRFYLEAKPCPTCHELFKPTEATSVYCSVACKNKGLQRQTELICETCQKPYSRRDSEVKWSAARGHETRFCSTTCRNAGLKGEKSPFWIADRSQLKDQNKSLRMSHEMKEWRKAVFTKDNWTCRLCLDRSRKGHRVTLNAHHIKRFADRPDLMFEVSNGVTLCDCCHKKTYGREDEYEALFSTSSR
jgi:hypothetical protein